MYMYGSFLESPMCLSCTFPLFIHPKIQIVSIEFPMDEGFFLIDAIFFSISDSILSREFVLFVSLSKDMILCPLPYG